MTEQHRAPGDAYAAAERLLAELRANGDTDSPQDDDSNQTELQQRESPQNVHALSTLGDDAFSPGVLAAVDALLRPGEAVGATARARMGAGAERAVRWRHAMLSGLLPVVLRAEREAAHLSSESVAAAINLAPATVAAVELGKQDVQTLSAEAVASWIRTVGLSANSALEALERSLASRVGDGVYAARGGPVETAAADAKQFYEQVAALLED